MSAEGMTACVIWTKLQEAIAKDGTDLRDTKKCGPEVSKVIRELVNEMFDRSNHQ